jgi:hypothetical protein
MKHMEGDINSQDRKPVVALTTNETTTTTKTLLPAQKQSHQQRQYMGKNDVTS